MKVVFWYDGEEGGGGWEHRVDLPMLPRQEETVCTNDGRVFQTFEVTWYPAGVEAKEPEDRLPFVSVQVIPTFEDVGSPSEPRGRIAQLRRES